MGFQERLRELEECYGAEILTPQALEKIWTDCHHQTIQTAGVRGAYHLWEDGFSRGDASREDVFADAKKLSEIVREDYEDALSDVLVTLDGLFLEIYRDALMKKFVARKKKTGSR